jgi:phytoene synthase
VDRIGAHGQAVIEQGSKSFAAATRLYDRPTRTSVYMLYAWCRHCDDQADDQRLGFDGSRLPPEEGRARIDRLRDETLRALAGASTESPVFAGLARVVSRHQIPSRYPIEHLQGFVMDIEGREYPTLEHSLEYCYHVAGVVGIMMAYIMGVRDPATLDRAADLGLAFQLTNFCRDVTDDAAVGRVYLPHDWLAEAGVPLDQVERREHRDRIFEVVRRVLAEADRYYASARLGLSRLPLRSAWAVAAASAVYRDIGRLIVARGPDAWDRRASTGSGRKLVLAAAGGLQALLSRASATGPEAEPRTGLWTRPGRR